MYYDEGQTMDAIASTFGISRSTVSRLLRDAREQGIVRITLRPPGVRRLADLRSAIAQRYGVRTHVVPTRPDSSERERLRAVATDAAGVVEDLLQPDQVVGIAWGTTVTAVVEQLTPRPVLGAQIVQLNGAVNTEGSGLANVFTVLDRAASRWAATVHPFPVPAFFDYPSTREAMWRERSVRRVLEMQRRCRLAVFGVGAFDSEVPSQVHASGYLAEEDLAQLRSDGAVGDVCTVFLRADGSWRDVRMNTRCSGPSPAALASIPRRVLVASGARKAVPLRAALRADCATDLVLDEATAARLLSLD